MLMFPLHYVMLSVHFTYVGRIHLTAVKYANYFIFYNKIMRFFLQFVYRRRCYIHTMNTKIIQRRVKIVSINLNNNFL
jgi:hypothetical protein